MSIGVPGGVCLAAFSSRLTKTCSSRTSSTGTSGSEGGKSVVTASPLELLLRPDERDAGHVGQRLPFALDLQRSRLDPDHVEQVRHQAAHPLRFLDDGPRQLPARTGVARARRPGAAWSRRPRSRPSGVRKIVRQRAEQRGPEPLGLDRDLGPAAPLGERQPLERDGRLPGQGLEQAALARDRGTGAGSVGRMPSTPTERSDTASGTYSATAAGSVLVPWPAGWRWS